MNKPISPAVLLLAAVLTSCGDNALQDITGPIGSARVKFFNFGVSAPAVNFYAGSAKMTAISSTTGTESVLGTVYGSAGSGNFYSAVAPGDYTLTGRIAATVDKDLVIASVAATIVEGKNYSFYLSGIYNVATKMVEGFVVEDPYSAAFNFTVANVRFVNAISNSSPMALFAMNTTTLTEYPVDALVTYKGAGAFVSLPPGVYDLRTRLAGSATNLITRTAQSLVAGKTYTVGARGDMTVVSGTATNRPFLDLSANR